MEVIYSIEARKMPHCYIKLCTGRNCHLMKQIQINYIIYLFNTSSHKTDTNEMVKKVEIYKINKTIVAIVDPYNNCLIFFCYNKTLLGFVISNRINKSDMMHS